MQVFLIRHAEAVDETLVVRDPHRPLTTHGRTQARALGDRLRWHDCLPTHVWSSPLVRAVQSAELVVNNLHTTVPVEIVPALSPEGSARDLVGAIHALPANAAVLVIGHEPSLSGIGALLVADLALPALAKAEAVRIVNGRVRWRFAWNDDAPVPSASSDPPG